MATLIEVENILASNIVNYRRENNQTASGGALLGFFGGDDNEQGSVIVTFDEPSGLYTIIIGAFDENDGDPAARFSITQNGNPIGTLSLDQDPGGNSANNSTKVELTAASNLAITRGDTLTIQGFESGNEHARIDFIRFDLNNLSPTITSSNAVQVEENQTAVITVEATDPESNLLTYSLTGGADRDAFAIAPNTGSLSFVTAPDFENPQDGGSDNIYDVEVTVTDSAGLSASQTVSVRVVDVAERNSGSDMDNNNGGSSNAPASPHTPDIPNAPDSGSDGVVEDVFEQLPVIIRATPNPDRLQGNELDNKMRGLQENDVLRGQAGDDFISGNSGNDDLFGNTGNDEIRGRTGNDDVNGGSGDDRLIGDRGNDTIVGSGGDDFIKGGAGRDDLNGDKGNDELIGNGKRDEINGGAGNDTIVGGFGNDIITTGAGKDVVVYNRILDGVDRITDFSVGSDRLDLSNMVDVYNLDASTALDRNIGFVQRGTTTVVTFDRDGAGLKSSFVLVKLEGVMVDTMNANAFIF